MNRKITKGWGVGSLLRYLMGPGKENEHTAQHVVASWDGAPERHQPPGRAARGEKGCAFDVRALAAELNVAAVAGGVSLSKPIRGSKGREVVWHCSLRNHESDRRLSDEEWAQAAQEVMHRTGIARRGDAGGCRWVAIRHAEDHIHIAAVLVRQDTGHRINPWNDRIHAGKACRDMEVRFGITQTAPLDRTAVRVPTRSEVEKGARRYRDEVVDTPEASRVRLCRAVRYAAAGSFDESSFYDALKNQGVKVAWRRDSEKRLLGYAVWIPGDKNAEGRPVRFAGSTLAPDLSLPKLRARWAATRRVDPIPPEPGELGPVGQREVDAAVAAAVAAMNRARGSFTRPGPGGEARAGVVHAAEDMVIAVTEATGGLTEKSAPPGGPADSYHRAAREPEVGQPVAFGPVAAELRTAARRLLRAGNLSGRAGSAAAGAALILALSALLAEIIAYHQERQRQAQTAAARATQQAMGRRQGGSRRPPGGPDGREMGPRRPEQTRTTRQEPAPRATPAPTRSGPPPVPRWRPMPPPGHSPRGPGLGR